MAVSTGVFTVNIFTTVLLPASVVTTTGPVFVPAGTVHVIFVFVHVLGETGAPLKVSVDVPWLGPK